MFAFVRQTSGGSPPGLLPRLLPHVIPYITLASRVHRGRSPLIWLAYCNFAAIVGDGLSRAYARKLADISAASSGAHAGMSLVATRSCRPSTHSNNRCTYQGRLE